MAIFFTSDLHLGHKNILASCGRPFDTVEEMDDELIVKWNQKVGADDDVYILGDLAFRSANHINYYLKHMAGHKYLVVGNHDVGWMKNVKDINKMQDSDKSDLGPYFAEAVLLLTDVAEKMGYNMEKEVAERLNVYKEAGRVVFTNLSASPENKNPAAYHIGIEKLLVEGDKLTLYISSKSPLDRSELSYALRTFALILLDNSKPCYIGDIVERDTLLDMDAENFYEVDKEIALDGSLGIVSCRKE